MKALFHVAIALVAFAAPAFATAQSTIAVTSPVSNSTVSIPLVLTAAASPCSSQPISAMGYSIDAGRTTAVFATSINTQVTASSGSHILHVKSWGNQGAGCDTDVPITVSSSAAAGLFTDLTVSQPRSGAKLVSPFALNASETSCQSQSIAAMGYSIDDSSNTTVVFGAALNVQAVSPTGAHTLHVKSWGIHGSACVSNVAVNVVPSPTSTLPSNAIAVNAIQTLTNWQAESDTNTGTGGGTSTYGTTNLVNSPTLSGLGRGFITNYANYEGERFHASFGADTSATNFLYDGWFYLPSPSTNISNLEFDMNQVMANGQTVIFGFQCDYWSKTWDYTANAGTPQQFSDVWLHSTAACNVQNWATDMWHHVQIAYSRDAAGNATYQSVWLDNVEQDLNITVPSAFALGWSPTLLTNFQVDGMTAAPATGTAYVDKLTVYRW
ncbi:MAG TPA: hypothetical protein VFC37_20075 [Terracidiphilus sp.]|nr:hypothetical protein [Terracidiphilus sp.]